MMGEGGLLAAATRQQLARRVCQGYRRLSTGVESSQAPTLGRCFCHDLVDGVCRPGVGLVLFEACPFPSHEYHVGRRASRAGQLGARAGLQPTRDRYTRSDLARWRDARRTTRTPAQHLLSRRRRLWCVAWASALGAPPPTRNRPTSRPSMARHQRRHTRDSPKEMLDAIPCRFGRMPTRSARKASWFIGVGDSAQALKPSRLPVAHHAWPSRTGDQPQGSMHSPETTPRALGTPRAPSCRAAGTSTNLTGADGWQLAVCSLRWPASSFHGASTPTGFLQGLTPVLTGGWDPVQPKGGERGDPEISP